jgi:hypothetical protein
MAVDEYQWLPSIETHKLFLKGTRCTVAILTMRHSTKTQGVGKKYGLLKKLRYCTKSIK